MQPAEHRLSIFAQKLDRAAFVSYFLGAVVPLIALGIIVERFLLSPTAAPPDRFTSLALVCVVASIAALSLSSFFALRRMTRQFLSRLERDNRQLSSLLSASNSLAAAQHVSDAAVTTAR